MKLHEKLRYLVDERGRGAQARLAEITGDARPTISKWLSGKQEPPKHKLKPIADFFGVTVDYLLDDTQDKPLLRYAPLIGLASCGVPTESFNLVNEYVPIPPGIDPEGVYAVTAFGDSMHPTISDGETVLCSAKKPPSNGTIVHYTYNGESGIKKIIYNQDGSVTLMPLNMDCPGCTPIHIPKENVGDLIARRCITAYKML